MFDIQNYGSFCAAILVFQAIPGAGTLTILNATARNGFGAGMGAILGTLSGDFAFMIAAVAGLATVMNANPVLFQALQWFGAAYLCVLGLDVLRWRADGESSLSVEPRRSGWIHFRRAFAVSLANPKVMLFFVAFFPLFLRPGASAATLAAMMVHVTAISFLYQVGLALAGNAISRELRSMPWVRKIAARILGIALIGFGVRLAVGNR